MNTAIKTAETKTPKKDVKIEIPERFNEEHLIIFHISSRAVVSGGRRGLPPPLQSSEILFFCPMVFKTFKRIFEKF